uniref:Uncharacterized protein n=1 Tax=Oryza sativa subsp. japonica TaxID=39947 RepID=Q6Z6I7_ORYSJ|nr:hypothetical protein [Oryza sativa Japonica Group]
MVTIRGMPMHETVALLERHVLSRRGIACFLAFCVLTPSTTAASLVLQLPSATCILHFLPLIDHPIQLHHSFPIASSHASSRVPRDACPAHQQLHSSSRRESQAGHGY